MKSRCWVMKVMSISLIKSLLMSLVIVTQLCGFTLRRARSKPSAPKVVDLISCGHMLRRSSAMDSNARGPPRATTPPMATLWSVISGSKKENYYGSEC